MEENVRLKQEGVVGEGGSKVGEGGVYLEGACRSLFLHSEWFRGIWGRLGSVSGRKLASWLTSSGHLSSPSCL